MKWHKWCWLWIFLSVSAYGYSDAELDTKWQSFEVNPLASVAGSYPHQDCFEAAARKHNLPLALLLAVARGESDFDAAAVSSANAIGVMQIQWPGTAKTLGIHRKQALFDACTNIEAGARYLKQLKDQFGSIHRALAAYNYGPGRIKRAGNQLPKGAVWYSSYIHDHLQHIVSRQGQGNYSSIYYVKLLAFDEPFRAQAFARRLNLKQHTSVYTWFKRNEQFVVVAQFTSVGEKQRHGKLLRSLGFSV